jgi:hypothetical protein
MALEHYYFALKCAPQILVFFEERASYVLVFFERVTHIKNNERRERKEKKYWIGNSVLHLTVFER